MNTGPAIVRSRFENVLEGAAGGIEGAGEGVSQAEVESIALTLIERGLEGVVVELSPVSWRLMVP